MRALPQLQADSPLGRRTRRACDVLLVNVPFQSLTIPSTAIGYIAATTRSAGHRVQVADLNYPLAGHLIGQCPSLKDLWDRSPPTHLGQFVFSSLVYGGD